MALQRIFVFVHILWALSTTISYINLNNDDFMCKPPDYICTTPSFLYHPTLHGVTLSYPTPNSLHFPDERIISLIFFNIYYLD